MDLQSLPECYTPLQVLSLRSCKSLEPISGLHEYTSFRELTIEDCDGLKTHASIGLESCTSIRALGVHDLQQLRQYAGDGLDISLIEELTIYKSPKLISISDHGLTTLRKLMRKKIEYWPEILHILNVNSVQIQDQSNFSLPTLRNMRRSAFFSTESERRALFEFPRVNETSLH
ncbi:hypothetical protein PS2_039515 [Malus domestica]